MSKTESPPTDDSEQFDEDEENWVEAHRDKIEREAESDAPDAWVFENLLQSLEDDDADEEVGSS